MDFELTKSQKEIQKAAREFARGEFDKELALELDRKHEFPTNIWKKACDLGFVGVHFPEEYSGQGLGVLENIIIADEFCTRDSSIGAAIILSSFAAECVLRFGWRLYRAGPRFRYYIIGHDRRARRRRVGDQRNENVYHQRRDGRLLFRNVPDRHRMPAILQGHQPDFSGSRA
jgi:hypothetical protein